MSSGSAFAQPGMVVTFYSYKGGVGRSMALANVAALLAQWGRRVLVIDWDLEAPGLERYFAGSGEQDDPPLVGRQQALPGVVDIMLSSSQGQVLDWRRCLSPAGPHRGIHLLGAGKRDDGDYAARLQSLDWEKLFRDSDLGHYLERLRTEWIADYDFVFIDSRTGVSDTGGICCIQMPDVLVTLFTTNEQSLAGVRQVMTQAAKAHQALPFDRARLALVPVPARDESHSEFALSKQWRERFAHELGDFYGWLPRQATPYEALERLRIPYRAYWSFGEGLPVIAEGTSDPRSLGYAYSLLAKLIDSRLDWASLAAD